MLDSNHVYLSSSPLDEGESINNLHKIENIVFCFEVKFTVYDQETAFFPQIKYFMYFLEMFEPWKITQNTAISLKRWQAAIYYNFYFWVC